MAAVATGGQSSHLLPMLLMVPHSLLGRARGVALLGFGGPVGAFWGVLYITSLNRVR